MLAVAIPAGLLIGLSLGAFGGGGSILTVPALAYLLHQPPHAATARSLLIVGITAAAGMIAHQRAGRVRLGPGIASGVLGVAGAYAGEDVFPGYLRQARAILAARPAHLDEGPTGLPPDFEALRWFPLPPACLPSRSARAAGLG